MSRFAAVIFAVVAVAMSSTGTLAAQRGGRGFHGGGGNIRMAPAPANPVPAFSGRVVVPPVVSPVVRVSHFAPRVTAVQPVRRGFVRQPQVGVGFYSPYIWNWNPPFYNAPPYVEPTYVAPGYVAPAANQTDADLAYEVERLQRELDELRQNQSVPVGPPGVIQPPPPAAPEPPAIPTALIFRDCRRMSIHNYVIVGQTIWVLDEKTATKLSVSDLDLDATQRENRTQGLRFPLPAR